MDKAGLNNYIDYNPGICTCRHCFCHDAEYELNEKRQVFEILPQQIVTFRFEPDKTKAKIGLPLR